MTVQNYFQWISVILGSWNFNTSQYYLYNRKID